MKTKKATELKHGDKIEMLSGITKTVEAIVISGIDTTIYYVEGGSTYVLSNEEIKIH